MKNKLKIGRFLCICVFNVAGLLAFIKVIDLDKQCDKYANELYSVKMSLETSVKTIETTIEETSQAQRVIEIDVITLQESVNDLNTTFDEFNSKSIAQIEKQNRWNIDLTQDEIDLLARIVMLEAGNQSDWGMDAVVEVIFNRMHHEDFPDTLYDVLSAPGQFTTWKNRNIKAATPSEDIYRSIYYVLSGQTEVLPFETVYFGRSAQNDNIELIIEDHYFCNDKD